MKNKDTPWTKLFITLPVMICRISERDLDKSTPNFWSILRVTKRSYSAANTGIGTNLQKPARYESGGIYLKLRKDLFIDVWPNHSIDQEHLKRDGEVEVSEDE